MNIQRRPGTVEANGRLYRIPTTPTVVICVDGSEPGYIEAAIDAGIAPHMARIMQDGASTTALSAMPSFTNPNNISIITGRPPSVHGIAGNYFFDPETGEEVMMNDPRFLRCGTIMKALQDGGAMVAVVTAKDKLRALLGFGLDYGAGTAVAFSSEKADKVSLEANGIADALGLTGMPVPDVYSAALSEFVLAAGIALLRSMRPDVMYLSTTDYVQHKAAPGSAVANDFYAMLDRHVGALDAAGAVVVLTADHGMNDKHLPDGSPDVIFLQDLFDGWTGVGASRVILPITDPYVVHHGALGSFATVYLPPAADAPALLAKLRGLEGVEAALDRAEACARFELPSDRIGDIVVVSTRHKVLGTSRDRHDLSGLTEPLRSHGGRSEQTVPMIANRKVAFHQGHTLRNFDVFDVALNLVQPS